MIHHVTATWPLDVNEHVDESVLSCSPHWNDIDFFTMHKDDDATRFHALVRGGSVIAAIQSVSAMMSDAGAKNITLSSNVGRKEL